LKKSGILHPEINRVIASLGHGEVLVIADAGLPIPTTVQRIDLAITAGVPPFLIVLDAVLKEMEVERAIFAKELSQTNPELYQAVQGRISCPVDLLTHEKFKEETQRAVAVIRTGEFTPYANIILQAGVVFSSSTVIRR